MTIEKENNFEKVFLTGSTGAIGSDLLRLLVKKSKFIYILLRARDEKHLQERFNKLSDFLNLSSDERKQILPIKGDITQPKLGMSSGNYECIIKNANLIIHSAADVRLHLNVSMAVKSSLTPLIEILRMSEKMKFLTRIHYVSTVGVSGTQISSLKEALIPFPREFHNTYEYSKSLCENELRRHFQRGTPITLYRPSMVVGNSKTGEIIKFQVFYFISEIISGRKSFGILPQLNTRTLDIIPVDILVEMISLSLDNPNTIGKVLHLCSGPKKSISLIDLQKMIINIYNDHHIYTPKLKFVPTSIVKLFIDKIKANFQNNKINALKEVFEYVNTNQYFENKETLKILNINEDFIAKPEEYIRNIFEYYIKKRMR